MEPTQRTTGFPSFDGRTGVSLSALPALPQLAARALPGRRQTRVVENPTSMVPARNGHLVGSRVFVFCPAALAVMFPRRVA